MSKLIVVSNRVSLPRRSGGRSGGLKVALQAVFKEHEGLWFGWSGRVVMPDALETRTISEGNPTYITTDLTTADYEEYYNGFANRVLWPILHYRLDLADYRLRDLTGYLRVNDHFAEELHKIISREDVIWVHDYHLIPLAKALRARGHKNRIGFFLHTPMPPADILTALPNHEGLFPTLCDYDLVGFQTETDNSNLARYLTSQCRMTSRDLTTFHSNGRSTALGQFPVGVDMDEMQRWAIRSQKSAQVRSTIDSFRNRTMLIGVDRLDYSKGIVPRMLAFEQFLLEHDEWRERATLLQISPRTRMKIHEYAEVEADVNATVGRINGNLGQADWTPIRYVNQSYTRQALAGMYRHARVGLVTPFRDGMNLVAKEFIASQNADDPSVLILSQFAGAARECTGAIIINPYDTESIAKAIQRALTMPLAERRERHLTNLENLKQSDIGGWGAAFLKQLNEGDNPQRGG